MVRRLQSLARSSFETPGLRQPSRLRQFFGGALGIQSRLCQTVIAAIVLASSSSKGLPRSEAISDRFLEVGVNSFSMHLLAQLVEDNY